VYAGYRLGWGNAAETSDWRLGTYSKGVSHQLQELREPCLGLREAAAIVYFGSCYWESPDGQAQAGRHKLRGSSGTGAFTGLWVGNAAFCWPRASCRLRLNGGNPTNGV